MPYTALHITVIISAIDHDTVQFSIKQCADSLSGDTDSDLEHLKGVILKKQTVLCDNTVSYPYAFIRMTYTVFMLFRNYYNTSKIRYKCHTLYNTFALHNNIGQDFSNCVMRTTSDTSANVQRYTGFTRKIKV